MATRHRRRLDPGAHRHCCARGTTGIRAADVCLTEYTHGQGHEVIAKGSEDAAAGTPEEKDNPENDECW
jgi:hypothetical protein